MTSAPPSIDESQVPAYAPGVRLRHDKVRGGWVVLAPERLFMPDEHALEILRLVDGQRNVAAIVDDLAARFAAPRDLIATDVAAMLSDLMVKGAIRL
jgi:pyrroloquinoline quinone biosynthesis protein D